MAIGSCMFEGSINSQLARNQGLGSPAATLSKANDLYVMSGEFVYRL